MIEALISGKLVGKPTARTSQGGKQFVTAKLRAPMAEGEAVFVSVIAFSEHVKAGLLALGDGDALAVAGPLKVSTWTNAEGISHPKVDLIANGLLSVRDARRKRAAVTGEGETSFPRKEVSRRRPAETSSATNEVSRRPAPVQGEAFPDDDL